ncbi:MAG: PAS domain S-box protein, partial [Gammaproteobacteria bacterium]
MQPRSTHKSLVALLAASAAGPAVAADAGITPVALLAVALVLLVALSVLALTLRSRLARRERAARELTDAVENLTQGNLSVAIGSSDPAEVGALARSLERLRQSLRTSANSRDYLSQVIASISDAVILTRLDGTISRVNTAAERLFGQTATELGGQHLVNLVAENVRPGFALTDGKSRTRETTFVNAAGDEVPVSYTGAEITADDPALQGYVITARNISERKVAEQRIRYLARIDALTKV